MGLRKHVRLKIFDEQIYYITIEQYFLIIPFSLIDYLFLTKKFRLPKWFFLGLKAT